MSLGTATTILPPAPVSTTRVSDLVERQFALLRGELLSAVVSKKNAEGYARETYAENLRLLRRIAELEEENKALRLERTVAECRAERAR